MVRPEPKSTVCGDGPSSMAVGVLGGGTAAAHTVDVRREQGQRGQLDGLMGGLMAS